MGLLLQYIVVVLRLMFMFLIKMVHQLTQLSLNRYPNWEYKLKGGTFNGMIDMYESREDSPTTDNGTY